MDIISVGGEYGGLDIPEWLRMEQRRLNRVLEKYCQQPYNDEVPSFILALRVEGSVKSFGFVGIDDVARMPLDDAVGADISVTRQDWTTDQATYRVFLWRSVKEAIWACVAKLKEDKLVVDEERLKRDLARVEREFLVVN